MRDKAEKDKKKWKQDAERAEDKRLRALYEAEKKLKGKKALGTFDEWKKNVSLKHSFLNQPSFPIFSEKGER